MTRFPDWQTRLHRFFHDHAEEKFHYGRWDCCLFVCGAVEAMTGVDLAAGLRNYSSRAEARRVMRARCGSDSLQDFVEAVALAHGMTPAPILMARRGDVALVRRSRRGFSLGLIAQNGFDVVVPSSKGLWALPLSTAIRAWHT